MLPQATIKQMVHLFEEWEKVMLQFAVAQELKNAGFSPSSAVPPSPAMNSLRPIGHASSRFIGSLPISTPGSGAWTRYRGWTRYQGVCEGVSRCKHVANFVANDVIGHSHKVSNFAQLGRRDRLRMLYGSRN
jgi:hypothetical protein